MNWRTANVFHYLFLLSCALGLAATSAPMLWTFELLNITTTSTNKDIMNVEARIIRLSRGRFGFAGFIEFTQPADDQLQFQINTRRSLMKNGPYTNWPVTFSENLSTLMNKYYKPLAMTSLAECCNNAPVFEGTFVPPLTPRRMELNDCVMNTDNMPNIMMEGYYWVTIKITNVTQDEVIIMFQTYVESEKAF